jgi:hypothetical protein
LQAPNLAHSGAASFHAGSRSRIRNGFTTTITITVHATADDCRLYDLPGQEDAAIALNQRFEALVNKGATRSEVRNGMCLSDYANLGAVDTGVRYFVEDILDRTFS